MVWQLNEKQISLLGLDQVGECELGFQSVFLGVGDAGSRWVYHSRGGLLLLGFDFVSDFVVVVIAVQDSGKRISKVVLSDSVNWANVP